MRDKLTLCRQQYPAISSLEYVVVAVMVELSSGVSLGVSTLTDSGNAPALATDFPASSLQRGWFLYGITRPTLRFLNGCLAGIAEFAAIEAIKSARSLSRQSPPQFCGVSEVI